MNLRLPMAVTLLLLLVSHSASRAGHYSGTVSASYQRSEQDARLNSDSTTTGESTSWTKQSTILVNYEDVLFSKNLMRLGLNYFIQRDASSPGWSSRPIYYFDLSSAGYTYNGSYSPRKQSTRLQISPGRYVETSLYFRDWRNSLTLNYAKLPVVNLSYNISRYFDDAPVRATDRYNRYITAQTGYIVGPATASVIYTNSKNENRVASPRTRDKYRTWQGTASFAHSYKAIGTITGSYSYLNTRAGRDALTPTPVSTSSAHTMAAMATSRELYKLSTTVSYSGRFQLSNSDAVSTNSSDQNLSGQLSFSPLDYLSFSMTKNYQIASQSGRNRIGENLSFSAAFTRFIRRGLETRLNWSRTYTQRSDEIIDSTGSESAIVSHSSSNNYTDAVFASFAATPYHGSKLLTDISISRANLPWLESQRYLSSRSVNLSVSITRKIEGRLSATYTNQGATLDLFRSYSRIVSAGATYLVASNLNCNLAYTQNDINVVPRVSTGALNGYLAYSFRNVYSVYVYMNQQRQDLPSTETPGQSAGVRKPRSWSGQLQIKLTRRSTLSITYTRSSTTVSGIKTGGTHSLQINYYGQF